MVMAMLYAVYTEMTILYAVDSPFLHLLVYPHGAIAIHTGDDTSQQTQNAFHNGQRDACSTQSVLREKCVGITALCRARNS